MHFRRPALSSPGQNDEDETKFAMSPPRRKTQQQKFISGLFLLLLALGFLVLVLLVTTRDTQTTSQLLELAQTTNNPVVQTSNEDSPRDTQTTTQLLKPDQTSNSLVSQTSNEESPHVILHRRAREEQAEFCRQLASGQNRTSESSEPKTRVVEIQSPFHKDRKYSIEVYAKNDWVSNFVANKGGWEGGVAQMMSKWVQDYANEKKMDVSQVTFVDIGANVGTITLAVADFGANVVAIEPMPQNLELLRRSLCRNPQLMDRITIHPVGLSAVPNQKCVIFSKDENVGDGMLACGSETDPAIIPRKYRQGYTVRAQIPLRRIDDIIAPTYPLHIAAIKMDTEGSEGNVVQGGPLLFGSGRVPHIFTEYSYKWIKEKGTSPRAFINTFLGAGYKVRKASSTQFWSKAKAKTLTASSAWKMEPADYIFEKSLSSVSLGK